MSIAIFGGSFDPYHAGHDAIKTHLLSLSYIDTILLIPANIAPNKPPTQTPATHRLAMLRFAVTDPKILVNDYEIDRGGVSYSIHTVEYFKRRYPTQDLYYVIGSDSFFGLHTWKEASRLASLTKFLVYAREETPRDTYRAYLTKHFSVALHSHFIFPKIQPMAISSTDLRQKLMAGEPPVEFLSQPVIDYINQYGLYPPPPKKK